MDDKLTGGLEEYLNGAPSREFLEEIARDPLARRRVNEIAAVSGLLKELKPVAQFEPSTAFYARLASRIEERQAQRRAWNPFAFDSAFGRKVAFASLLTLATIGSWLVARDNATSPVSPEAILASHDPNAEHDAAADRGTMLVTLASFEQ